MSRRAPGQAAEERRPLRAAAIAAALLVLVTVGVFLKENPFASPYEIKGVFTTSNQLRKDSAVRIGGLDVGKVVKIEAGDRNTSVVTMEITDRDVPIRSDAELEIEPRLVLEGNFYVRISPGSPNAAELADGGTIPLSRTSVPVQLDQVLGTLDEPTRTALQGTFREFATGLGPAGPAGGAAGLRQSVRELDRALGSITQVSEAAQGTKPGDLRRAVRSSGAVTEQLAESPEALAGIVESYSRVSGALAARDQALARTVRGFDQVMRAAPSSLRSVNAALPVLTEFAKPLRPALHAAPSALRNANGLLDQLDLAVGERELPALLGDLDPVTATLPALTRDLRKLATVVTPVTECLNHNVLPALNQVAPDNVQSTGDPIWLEALHLGASLAATSPNFDGNGSTIRLGVTESEQAIQGLIPGLGTLEGSGTSRGLNPTWLGSGNQPPSRPDVPCVGQTLPDLGARAADGPDWATPVTRPQPAPAEKSKLRDSVKRLLAPGTDSKAGER